MFEKEPTMSRAELLQRWTKDDEHHTSTIKALVDMGKTLKDIDVQMLQDKAETDTLVTVTTGQEQTFYAGGFRYNRLYIGDNAAADGAKLIIRMHGVQWTLTLAAGENKTNIPDGATFQGDTTSGNNFPAVLIRSNKE